MTDFSVFKTAVQKQMDKMATGELFVTAVEKDALWDTYLASFPPGTNPIFRKRTEHDCQCCKQFIRSSGAIVTAENDSIWDVEVGGYYQAVADALSALVKSRPIADCFLHYTQHLGTDHNHQQTDSGILRWNHFHYKLPVAFVKPKDQIPTILGRFRSSRDTFDRALKEISVDAVETVLELIAQGSLYRGEEHKNTLKAFKQHKQDYSAAPRENYSWAVLSSAPTGIRGSVIGTLLLDLSGGRDMEAAVKAFEEKVAPANYKRPSALVTKDMIEKAKQRVTELGLISSLERRHATMDDVPVTSVRYTSRNGWKEPNIFDDLTKEAQDKRPKAEKMSLARFLGDVLPSAHKVEVYLENKHESNLVSLIAPVYSEAPALCAWSNNFSWSYNGDLADSIKQRVQKAGGNVTGALRCSLAWYNTDDLDIHVIEPDGNHIYYGKRHSRTSGELDVDMNVSSPVRNAVENVTWDHMLEGKYKVYIHNYTLREAKDFGFEVELEHGGTVHTFRYDKKVNGNVDVVTFNYSKKDGVTVLKSIPSTAVPKTLWELKTQKFHEVSLVMDSPNHWGQQIGNRHLFFFLEGCANSEPTRGFFNELLRPELREHRKVFEILGSKMKAEPTTPQLSGVGFSSTQRHELICRVTGNFTRTVSIQL